MGRMVDLVSVTVVAAVAGFLLYELGWLSNAVTLSYWCAMLLPTLYAVAGCVMTFSGGTASVFWLATFVVVTVSACMHIPRCAAFCGALAIVYDHHYYPMNGPDDDRHSEEGFAKDLCCAFARIRWLRDLVAWLRVWRWRPFAERAIAITMYCGVLAARIPVVSFCALYLSVVYSATGCAKVLFPRYYGKLDESTLVASVILLAGCAAACWWTPHVAIAYGVISQSCDIIVGPITEWQSEESSHLLAKGLRRVYREYAKPRLENIHEGAVAAAVGVPFVAVYVAIFTLGGESAPVTPEAGTELDSS